MKPVNLLLNLLALLLLGLYSCKTSEQKAVSKLHKASEQIKQALREHPELVDSTKNIVHDTIRVKGGVGSTQVQLVMDTTKYNTLLGRYVSQRDQYIALIRQQDKQPATTPVNPYLAVLKRQNQALRDSLYRGAYDRDTVYTYADTNITINSAIIDGRMHWSYKIKDKKYAYTKEEIGLNLHDCIDPPFYTYWQFWAAMGGWVLIGFQIARRTS